MYRRHSTTRARVSAEGEKALSGSLPCVQLAEKLRRFAQLRHYLPTVAGASQAAFAAMFCADLCSTCVRSS